MVQAEQICLEWRGSEWGKVQQKGLIQSAEGWSYLNLCWRLCVHVLCTYRALMWMETCMPASMNHKRPWNLQSLLQLCLKHLHISQPCWNTQWHPVPLTPTSVLVPFPLALWLAALYPDRYTAPGCPTGLWGNEIQMPQYLRYRCPKPAL